MPKQKDLKRIVRSRMKKTGESYSAARLQILRKRSALAAPQPPPDYEALAGMSDAAVRKATGRGWAEWVEILDREGAAEKPHRLIAQYVQSLGTPDWWSQGVTVGYERIRGLREMGQRRDGSYEAARSRTFSVPLDELYAAFANSRRRARWLKEKIHVRTANPNKTMRVTWEDGTLVQLYFVAKGQKKSQVAVQHQKLASRAAANSMKSLWTERLDHLAEYLSR